MLNLIVQKFSQLIYAYIQPDQCVDLVKNYGMDLKGNLLTI